MASVQSGWSLLTVADSFQESRIEKSDLQSNGKNLDVYGFHCDNWVWNSNDPSSVHTRRHGPKETSSPGLKSLVQRAKANRISINLFSWNQVHVSQCLFGKSFWNASCWNCWMYESWVSPISWAKVESPMIFLVVVSSRLVGGSRTEWIWRSLLG